MNYFLAKTDPDTYSIDRLHRERETIWDGVHNYQAINFIKSWEVGDLVFVYHSQDEKEIVGLMQVMSEAYKDPNDKRGISWAAKVKFVRAFEEKDRVSLKEIKESKRFPNFLLVTHSRLSVMPCPPDFVEWMKKRTRM